MSADGGLRSTTHASGRLALGRWRERLREALGGEADDAVRFASIARCLVDASTGSLVLLNRSATPVRTPRLLVLYEPFRYPHVPDALLVDGRRGAMVMVDRSLRIRVTLGERAIAPGARIELPIRARPIEAAAPVSLDAGSPHAESSLAVRSVDAEGRAHAIRSADQSALTTFCAAADACSASAGAASAPASPPRHSRRAGR